MSLEALIKAHDDAKAAYLKAADSGTVREAQEASGAVKAAQVALAAAITEGAKPCPSCGGHPHGMIQAFKIDQEIHVGCEVGCPSCYDHLATGVMAADLAGRRALAVANWNAGPDKWFKAAGVQKYLLVEGEVHERLEPLKLESPTVSWKVPAGDDRRSTLAARDARVAAARAKLTRSEPAEPGVQTLG
jgi:hypothetical protein